MATALQPGPSGHVKVHVAISAQWTCSLYRVPCACVGTVYLGGFTPLVAMCAIGACRTSGLVVVLMWLGTFCSNIYCRSVPILAPANIGRMKSSRTPLSEDTLDKKTNLINACFYRRLSIETLMCKHPRQHPCQPNS